MSEEKKKDDDIGCGGMIVIFLVGFLAGTLTCFGLTDSYIANPLKSKAVELGSADWVVNPKDGTTKFTWKEKTDEQKPKP